MLYEVITDHRYIGKTRVSLDPAQEFDAIHTRHHAIEDHQREIVVRFCQTLPGSQRIGEKLEPQPFLLEKISYNFV